MDEKIPVSNNTKMPMYVAGYMIPPGETRHFDRHQVPPEHQPAKAPDAAPQEQDPLDALRAGTVAAVTAGFALLADGELRTLRELEAAAAKPRKSLLEAIDTELLARAAESVDGTGSDAGEQDGSAEGAGDAGGSAEGAGGD